MPFRRDTLNLSVVEDEGVRGFVDRVVCESDRLGFDRAYRIESI